MTRLSLAAKDESDPLHTQAQRYIFPEMIEAVESRSRKALLARIDPIILELDKNEKCCFVRAKQIQAILRARK